MEPRSDDSKGSVLSDRFEVTVRSRWTTNVVLRSGEHSWITLPAGTLLVHAGTDWTVQGCAGFENPGIVSRYRVVDGEFAGAIVEEVAFLGMPWQAFDEELMLRPFVPVKVKRND